MAQGEDRVPPRLRGRLAPAVVAGILFACLSLPALPAASWEFQPELGFNVQYDENPFSVQEAQENIVTGTWSGSLGVWLPVTRSTRRSSLELNYVAWLTTYDRFKELNGIDQLAELGWNTSWSRRSSFTISNTLRMFMDQARVLNEEIADDSPVFIRRSRVTRNTLRASLSVEMTRHLDFETSLAGLEIRYEGISEIEDSIEGARTIYSGGSRYGGRIGVGWRHSEDIVSQYFVSYDRITEDPRERVDDNGESVAVPGSERDVHGIGASVTLPTGRGGGLLYIEGGLARVGADELRPESEQTRTTFGEIRWRKQYRRGAAFEVGYVHRIGSSFGTGGGNVVRAAYVSYDQPFGPRFSGRVAGGYADRTGIEESIESRDRQTLRLNAELVRSIGERVGITLGYRRLWQESPRIDQQVAYNVYRLGIRWYPRGRK